MHPTASRLSQQDPPLFSRATRDCEYAVSSCPSNAPAVVLSSWDVAPVVLCRPK